MSIAKDKTDLEALIYGGQLPAQPKKEDVKDGMVDAESSVMEDEQLLFTFDYENDMRGFRKKAAKTVTTMAYHMLPKDILEEEYVKNKIEQDIDTLAELYWTRKSNTDIKLSIMNEISHGNTAPRMYDAYKSINDSIADNNKQILATEDNLRKTYTDLKYEIQCKRAERDSALSPLESAGIISTPKEQTAQLPQQTQRRVFTGTKSMIEMAKKRKKEEYLKKQAEDVEFNEVNQ